MRLVTIAELRAGGEVDGVYACTRKDRLTARNGTPYLAVELRDRTGAIPGRAFRDADFLASQFERGDLVSVAGRVERFRDELQVDLRAIKTAEADPSEFLPVAYRDIEELDGFLEHLAREVYDPDLARLLGSFLGDEGFRADLRRAPCTRAGHHAYLGGLIEHTVAVATLAQEAALLHPRLNSDLLLCAAILHDIGQDARVRSRRGDPAQRGRRARGTRGARAAAGGRARTRRSRASRTRSCTRSLTASWPTTGRSRCPGVASARWRRSLCSA